MNLETILESNPFTEELVDQWKGQLKDGAKARCGFLLPSDEEELGKDTKIFSQYIPQPFIGSPSAPVWLLNENPSPFESDDVAMLSAKPAEGAGWQYADEESLRIRQKLMCDQLRLKVDGGTFFPLEKVFDVTGGKGSMYGWWHEHVLGGGTSKKCFPFREIFSYNAAAGLIAEGLFVLEAFPYRTKNWNKKYLNASREYHAFWWMLMEYAFENGKMLLIRANRNSQLWREIEKNAEDLCVYGVGPCSAHLSNDNAHPFTKKTLKKFLQTLQETMYGRGFEVPDEELRNDVRENSGATGRNKARKQFSIMGGVYAHEYATMGEILRHVARKFLELNKDCSRDDYIKTFKPVIKDAAEIPDCEGWRDDAETVNKIFKGRGGYPEFKRIVEGVIEKKSYLKSSREYRG